MFSLSGSVWGLVMARFPSSTRSRTRTSSEFRTSSMLKLAALGFAWSTEPAPKPRTVVLGPRSMVLLTMKLPRGKKRTPPPAALTASRAARIAPRSSVRPSPFAP